MSSVFLCGAALLWSCASSSQPDSLRADPELVAALETVREQSARQVGDPSDQRPMFSKFGDQVLGRATRVVKGTVVAVATAPNSEVVRIEVSSTFKGETSTEVVVLANRGEFFEGSELLLFLTPLDGGPRYTSFNHISTSDPDYAAKEEHLQRQAKLEDEEDDDLRREMARDFLLQTARSDAKWTRWNMLRELDYVLRRYPGMLRDEDAAQLEEIAGESEDEGFALELRALLKKRKERNSG